MAPEWPTEMDADKKTKNAMFCDADIYKYAEADAAVNRNDVEAQWRAKNVPNGQRSFARQLVHATDEVSQNFVEENIVGQERPHDLAKDSPRRAHRSRSWATTCHSLQPNCP